MGAFNRSPRQRENRALVCVVALLLGGCALDERTLQGVPDPSGGIMNGLGGADGFVVGPGDDAGGVADAEAGGHGAGAQGGTSGTPSSGTTVWSFDADVGGFEPEVDVEQQWSSEDAASSSSSGSLMLTNVSSAPSADFSSVGTLQCVPVLPGATYDISMQIYIAPGQNTGAGGFAVQFFDDPECSGTLVGLANFLTATTGAWQLGERPSAPIGAKSVQIHLVASKVERDPSFTVLFDDVSLQAL